MDIEVTFTAVNGNQSVCIRAREQMETCNKEKIQTMKDAVNAFIPSGQQGQIEVRCSPNTLPPSPAQKADNAVKKAGSEKMISEKQINLLMRRLRENNTSVQELCQVNGVKRIQDLTMAKAREIIHDLSDF